jgi:hypothetical protein
MPYCTTDWYVSNRVGIGTDNPGFRLVICDNTSPLLQFKNPNDNSFGVIIEHTGTGSEYWNYENGFIRFGTSNAERMRITNTGNIGIGTSSPDSKLHVQDGQIRIHGAPSDSITGTQGYYIANTCNNEAYNWQMSCNFNLGLWTFSNTAGGGWGLRGPVITQSGRFGIGTTSPRFSLDVAGGAMSNFYMSCCNASLDGIGPYDYGIIGSGNGAGALLINDIVGARYSVHAGSYNLTFRKSVRNTVGACVYCTVMQFVGTTDTNCVVNVNIENRLGVGTASPSYRLHVNGTFYAAGSSADYKQGVCQYNTDSCMFMKLNPVTYQYKDEYTHLGKELKSETQIGLIAEDVAEVYPELAILVNEDDQKIVRNVDYEKLSIVLLSEVQKLRKEMDELKTK